MTFIRNAKLASVLTALAIQLPLVAPTAIAQRPIAVPPAVQAPYPKAAVKAKTAKKKVSKSQRTSTGMKRYPGSVRLKSRKRGKRPAPIPPPPQTVVGNMSQATLAPGIVHKVHRGAMSVNLLDVDLGTADVVVKPILAGDKFDVLEEVRDQAQRAGAIAAVNGNYFKRDGTPLGTLIVDGEWVAGPLYDRTSMGITRDGRVLVDRVKLHGTLTTSNALQPNIWVNNINQPRRTGAKLIAYTRRWGDVVEMRYAGTLLAVDSTGRVTGKTTTRMGIPYGGFVLSDSKSSPIADLEVGDEVRLSWHVSPSGWDDVVNAVSGGPVLIRDGKLFVNTVDERFNKAWTGNHIKARTAVGVTADRHLLLATIEGRHTLWDVAKFLKKLGCTDAMNLDGGGSTTMVVRGKTVTRNGKSFERRVASSVAIVPRSLASVSEYRGAAQVKPDANPAPLSVAVKQPDVTPPEQAKPEPRPEQWHLSTYVDQLPRGMTGYPRLPLCPQLALPQIGAVDTDRTIGRPAKHYSILPTREWGTPAVQPAETRKAGKYFGLFKRSEAAKADDKS